MIKMSQRLLIAYDKNTVGVNIEFDCIYDEFATFDELLMKWASWDGAQYYGPWEIAILDAELFLKFKNDFFKLKKFIPALQNFESVWRIFYYDNEGVIHIVEFPNEGEMALLETIMERDLWTRKENL